MGVGTPKRPWPGLCARGAPWPRRGVSGPLPVTAPPADPRGNSLLRKVLFGVGSRWPSRLGNAARSAFPGPPLHLREAPSSARTPVRAGAPGKKATIDTFAL